MHEKGNGGIEGMGRGVTLHVCIILYRSSHRLITKGSIKLIYAFSTGFSHSIMHIIWMYSNMPAFCMNDMILTTIPVDMLWYYYVASLMSIIVYGLRKPTMHGKILVLGTWKYEDEVASSHTMAAWLAYNRLQRLRYNWHFKLSMKEHLHCYRHYYRSVNWSKFSTEFSYSIMYI